MRLSLLLLLSLLSPTHSSVFLPLSLPSLFRGGSSPIANLEIPYNAELLTVSTAPTGGSLKKCSTVILSTKKAKGESYEERSASCECVDSASYREE